MKQKLFIAMLVVFTLGIIVAATPPAQAMSSSCEDLVSNVVTNSAHTTWDFIHCALTDPGSWWDIVWDHCM